VAAPAAARVAVRHRNRAPPAAARRDNWCDLFRGLDALDRRTGNWCDLFRGSTRWIAGPEIGATYFERVSRVERARIFPSTGTVRPGSGSRAASRGATGAGCVAC
jgi:hypothetical protein